jgi:aspartyl-tRNA(Asn)/glutamyl-tRNA(Gln) amidotransferase subunit B
MENHNQYEAVIGLEVHAQLLTNTKAYSSDENIYGAIPNTKTSAITLGHPGTLPVSNKKVIEFAVKLGIAVGAGIRKVNRYARKNYFYADLPKGYQITQDDTPICNGGFIEIPCKENKTRKINITRIHMEEDAGKSIHDLDPFNTLIDLNRAGVPLLEIVSEPEIKSGKEAFDYIMEIRKLVRHLGICDGNMEEGSLRCDANISVMIKGAKTFGTKVEVKNMNSSRNVRNAIDFEIKRQIDIIEKGGSIIHETRGFDASKGITLSQRHKEEANDYRYFPEPDLQPIEITTEYISKVKENMPLLPKELFVTYTEQYKLSDYDASLIIEDKNIASYFNQLCKLTNNYKAAANFINGVIKSHLNERALNITELDIKPLEISDLIRLIDDKKISNSVATSKIFPILLNSNQTAEMIAIENNWIQESDDKVLKELIKDVLAKFPQKVEEYRNGKKGLIGMFMGEVMKLSKGKADPKITNILLRDQLEI